MAPVVADASALLALARLNRLELLRDLFQQVSIPSTVSREVSGLLPRLPDWIRVVEPRSMSVYQPEVGGAGRAIARVGIAAERSGSVSAY